LLPLAYSGQAQIHESDVGKILLEQFDRLFAAAGLGNRCHIRRGLDDGRNPDAHDRMIVNDKDPYFAGRFHFFELVHFRSPWSSCDLSLTPPALRRRMVKDGDHREDLSLFIRGIADERITHTCRFRQEYALAATMRNGAGGERPIEAETQACALHSHRLPVLITS
jgi:hypothetical protein